MSLKKLNNTSDSETNDHNMEKCIIIDHRKDLMSVVSDSTKNKQNYSNNTYNVNANSFELALIYLYKRFLQCDHIVGISLILTLIKLKFVLLAKEIVSSYFLIDDECSKCSFKLSVDNCDALYYIVKSLKIENLIFLNRCKNLMNSSQEILLSNNLVSDENNCLTLKFLKPRYVNYLEFKIPQKFKISFNVRVSLNRKKWIKIVNNSNIRCEGWNWFYFSEKRIKFIRIDNCQKQKNEPFLIRRHFNIQKLKCYYKNKYLNFDNETGLLIPLHNAIQNPVKDIKHKYCDYLLTYCMSKALDEIKTEEYYYHKIGNGNIEFYLPQTCLINAIKFRLWDQDNRTYDYIVEVLADDSKYWKVIGKFNQRSSYQTVEFGNYIVTRWIRITGTKCPDNVMEFAISDFQCPPQIEK